MIVTYKDFKRSSEYRKQKIAVVFRFHSRYVVMGLWKNSFKMTREFTTWPMAYPWFKRMVKECSDELQHNKERHK